MARSFVFVMSRSSSKVKVIIQFTVTDQIDVLFI